MEVSEINNILKKLYYKAGHPASFTGIDKLYRYAITEKPSITRKQVKEWLSSQKAYTLHKPKRINFQRNHVVAIGVDHTWQADLCDMQAFKKSNDGYGYILTVIDVLSKYAFAIPIKTKHGSLVADSFEEIFNYRYPANIQTDQGTEFLNSDVQKLFKKFNINHYTTKGGGVKCSVVERFNRTLKTRMFKYFSWKGKHRFLDVLSNLVKSYNHTGHRSTGFAPVNITTNNEDQVFEKLYGFKSRREMMLYYREQKKKNDVPSGSTCRISYERTPQDKGYFPNWTDEKFKVRKVIKDRKNMYTLQDAVGEDIEGRFYPEEIQVINDNTYRIRILKKRIRRGVREVLVHWINHPSSQDSWIPESDLVEDG